MAFWDWLTGMTPEPAPVGRTNIEKIDAHVRRFTLALEQCEKGPEREAELRRNLRFWAAQKAAYERFGG